MENPSNNNSKDSITGDNDLVHLLDDDDDEVFNFSEHSPQFKSTAKPTTAAANTQNPNHFELRDENESILNNQKEDETMLKEDESVVILTPATQDIVFLDDSSIESMDLMKELMRNDTQGLENLKRIESER